MSAYRYANYFWNDLETASLVNDLTQFSTDRTLKKTASRHQLS